MTDLRDSLHQLFEITYPHPWTPVGLCVPLPVGNGSSVNFQVLYSNRQGERSQAPNLWYKFSDPQRNVLLVRPRRSSTAIREKLVLIEISQFVRPCDQICKSALVAAAHFARQSGFVVWHNPAKGGASQPQTAHFQAIPHRISVNGKTGVLAMPCFHFEFGHGTSWRKVQNPIGHLLQLNEYPLLGAVVWGSIDCVVEPAWKLIEGYAVEACNLIFEPPENEHESSIRIFIFPRSRSFDRAALSADQMQPEEQSLLQKEGGSWDRWRFATPELGLLSQGFYKPVYDQMCAAPREWGKIYSRLLKKVTLGEGDQDWPAFKGIFCQHF